MSKPNISRFIWLLLWLLSGCIGPSPKPSHEERNETVQTTIPPKPLSEILSETMVARQYSQKLTGQSLALACENTTDQQVLALLTAHYPQQIETICRLQQRALSSSPSPSFSCEPDNNIVEKSICSSTELSDADWLLHTLYQEIPKLAPALHSGIVEKQNSWLLDRNTRCNKQDPEQRAICLGNKMDTQLSWLWSQLLEIKKFPGRKSSILLYNALILLHLIYAITL